MDAQEIIWKSALVASVVTFGLNMIPNGIRHLMMKRDGALRAMMLLERWILETHSRIHDNNMYDSTAGNAGTRWAALPEFPPIEKEIGIDKLPEKSRILRLANEIEYNNILIQDDDRLFSYSSLSDYGTKRAVEACVILRKLSFWHFIERNKSHSYKNAETSLLDMNDEILKANAKERREALCKEL